MIYCSKHGDVEKREEGGCPDCYQEKALKAAKAFKDLGKKEPTTEDLNKLFGGLFGGPL